MSEGNIKESTNNKKIWIGLAILLVIIGIFVAVYITFGQKAIDGTKNITVEVVVPNQDSKEYTYKTEEEYLGAVLINEKLAEGSMGEFGLFITAVDGVVADNSKQQWWCITKQGGTVTTGADTTPIQDGDHFEITLTEGY